MKLLLIRHGRTELNQQNRLHKRGDQTGLDDTGRDQAHKTAIECKAQNVEAVYSSPERRAAETAEIIANDLGLEVIQLEALRERNWGNWTVRGWDDIKPQLETMDIKTRYTFVPPKGESWEQMEVRLKEALGVITASNRAVVALVLHGGTLRALMPILKKAPKEHSFGFDFANASITTFDCKKGRYQMIAENATSHLSN